MQGVEENRIELSIFPNPFGQLLEITAKNAQKLEIFDNFGRKIFEIKAEQDHFVLDAIKFDIGIYYIVVTDEEGICHVEKVVKVK